jgi:hypothetical protein
MIGYHPNLLITEEAPERSQKQGLDGFAERRTEGRNVTVL